jgi:REP element-mobilizing transposase RayT
LPYCEVSLLYYHLVWTTRNRTPLLTPTTEPAILDYLRWRAIGLGAAVFALGGATDHVHLVAAIPPRIAVASFVSQAQNSAASRFNRRTPEEPLVWADSYGAMTFDGKRLPYVIAYVERQTEHHAAGTIIPVLERTEEGAADSRQMREVPLDYHVDGDEAAWWREMLALA